MLFIKLLKYYYSIQVQYVTMYPYFSSYIYILYIYIYTVAKILSRISLFQNIKKLVNYTYKN